MYPYNPGGNTGGGNTGGGGNDGGGGGGGGGNNAGFVQYSRNISFGYPRGSEVVNRPYPLVPMLVAVMRSPDQAAWYLALSYLSTGDRATAIRWLRRLPDDERVQQLLAEPGMK